MRYALKTGLEIWLYDRGRIEGEEIEEALAQLTYGSDKPTH